MARVQFLLAFLFCVLGTVGAVEKLPLEQLHGDDSKDEHEELVDDEDVEDILQGRHHTVKHRLRDREFFSIEKMRLPFITLGDTVTELRFIRIIPDTREQDKNM